MIIIVTMMKKKKKMMMMMMIQVWLIFKCPDVTRAATTE